MSFWRNYYHLIWTTKNREPLIRPEFEGQLYSYLIKKAAELGCYTYAIGGIIEHVHAVLAIPPKHAVAYVVKTLKGGSSHYVNHVIRPANRFDWQRGYGCLTLGETQRTRAVLYVQQQKQHHAESTANAWLERADEFDEGPLDLGIPADGKEWVIAEQQADYTTFPF